MMQHCLFVVLHDLLVSATEGMPLVWIWLDAEPHKSKGGQPAVGGAGKKRL